MTEQSETALDHEATPDAPWPLQYMFVGLVVILVGLFFYGHRIVAGLVIAGAVVYAALNPGVVIKVLSMVAPVATAAVLGISVALLICLLVGFGFSKLFEVTPDG